ncbi:MAG: hypothetical protein WCK59_01575 [Candidatus Falkowbacteria bacterium]
MKLFKKLQTKAGFSLIEILAVLFVVSTSLLGILSLINQNIQVQSINRNNLIASSLAQEGVELIRQTRDSNWRAGVAYGTNLGTGSYRIDYRQDAPTPVSTLSEAQIYLKNGFYVNNSGGETGLTPTIFYRQVFLNKPSGYLGAPLQVRVLISWTDRKHPYNYELRTLLFDWR